MTEIEWYQDKMVNYIIYYCCRDHNENDGGTQPQRCLNLARARDNEHMPRKFVSRILLVNIAAINITHADVSVIIYSPQAPDP